MIQDTYTCLCDAKKQHRLVFDGGSIIGHYQLELCQKCYDKEDKRFVIHELKHSKDLNEGYSGESKTSS